MSLIALVLSISGAMPDFDIVKPSHSIFFWKNLHFDHLTAKL